MPDIFDPALLRVLTFGTLESFEHELWIMILWVTLF